MMGLHEHYDERPKNAKEAYESLHLDDVIDAVRFIKWGMSPGNSKKEAIEYVKHWTAWTKENDQAAYNRTINVQNGPENTP